MPEKVIPRISRALKTVAVVNFVAGVAAFLAALVLFQIGDEAIFAALRDRPGLTNAEHDALVRQERLKNVCLFAGLLALAITFCFAGYGLLKRKGWGKILTIALAIPSFAIFFFAEPDRTAITITITTTQLAFINMIYWIFALVAVCSKDEGRGARG